MPAKSRKQRATNARTVSELVAKIKAAPVKSSRWIDRLTPEQREVVEQLRSDWRAGEFPAGYSLRALYDATVEELGISVGITAFSEYFGPRGATHEAEQ